MLNKLLASVFIYLLSSEAGAVEIDLIGKLDYVQENVANRQQRLEGKHKIYQMLIDCKFDDQCILGMIDKLEQLTKSDPNLMYRAFLTYLKWQKSNLEYNVKHCQIPEKQAVREEFANCYAKWIKEEIDHPPESRNVMDQQETERYHCLEKNIAPLAEKGNIFAQAEMVNLAQYFADAKTLNLWSAKLESQKASATFNKFLQCSELP